MTYLDVLKTCYKKSFTLEGRASRSEFWLFQLHIPALLFCGVSVLQVNAPDVVIILPFIFFLLLSFVSIPALFCLIIRRWHDLGYSGWYILVLLAPFLGLFLMLIFFCMPSSEKGKKYDTAELNFHKIEQPEVLPNSQALTTAQIIAIKEAKELLDKNMITKLEFAKIKNEYTDGSVVTRLKGIADLRDSEVFTESEFQEQKSKILSETSSQSNDNLSFKEYTDLTKVSLGISAVGIIILILIISLFSFLGGSGHDRAYVEYNAGWCWSGAFHNGGSIISISGCGDESFNCMDNGDFCTINAQKEDDNAYELCVRVGDKRDCTTAGYGIAQV